MKFKIPFLLLFGAVVLQSCGSDTLANNKIDQPLRQTIHQKNDSLLNALSNSDMKSFQKLGSPDFIKHLQGNIGNVVWAFRKGYLETKFEVYDEFQVHQNSTPGYTRIESEEHKYTYTHTSDSKDSYLSLLKVVYNEMDDYLVSTTYEKMQGQWKLTSVHIGTFGMYGKNAEQYFTLAKEYEAKGKLIDAFDNINLAVNSLDPCKTKLKYENEDKIKFYAKTWGEQLQKKYKFPHKLENIRTRPDIAYLEPVKNAKGLFPMFSYITKIPLRDSVLLKQENELVQKEVRRQYPDLDFNKNFIYYRAYNETRESESFVEFKEEKPAL